MVRLMSNKGFTLIEMCLVLMFVSLLSLIPFKSLIISTDVKETVNELISTQYTAFKTHSRQSFDLPNQNHTITFNANGNITQATRIEFHAQKVQLTLMLATGRIFVRRVESD